MGRVFTEARLRPFETVVLVVAPVCGVLMMTLDIRPASVELAMPHLLRTAWEVGLLVAGGVDAPPPNAPQWVQVLLSALGVLGGLGGVSAIAAVVLQRGKFKADAADTLTDAALTLVQPLRARLVELEREMVEARTELASAQRTIGQLGNQVNELRELIERWRAAINDPEATLRKVRTVVSRSYRPPPGERPG